MHTNHYNCTKDQYFIQDHFLAPNHTKWSCPFTQSMLGPCSGLNDTSFGYKTSMPCVIIKMNRVRSRNETVINVRNTFIYGTLIILYYSWTSAFTVPPPHSLLVVSGVFTPIT